MLLPKEANPFAMFRLCALIFTVAIVFGSGAIFADEAFDKIENAHRTGFCSTTAQLQFIACKNEVQDDYFIGKAICLNLSDEDEREECSDEVRSALQEERNTCREQRAARLDLCSKIGEDRYDPDFDPANYDDDFTDLTNPNPYRPLTIGNVWEYESEDESVTVEVFDETKLIDGVTCIVVNDVVADEDGLVEDTDDWFAQRLDGTVVYCGEVVNDFEYFDGDHPVAPELVSIEGSFKAGRDGDKPGILFPGTPVVGETYRQEWSASNAEDAATVLSVSYSYGSDPELDEFAPRDLVEFLCDDDCVVTAEFTPIEPGGLEYKYFASGIGLFLEVKPEDGEVAQLVGCNFDPRCDFLPAP